MSPISPFRSRRTLTLTLVIVVLLVVPIAVYASHSFNDVPDSHTFHGDIDWLAEAGVTRGCNPPTNDEFCPDDEVTRGQMAAFLRRLATQEIVAAKTARFASDAGTLDGVTRESLLGLGTGNKGLRNESLTSAAPRTMSVINVSTGEQPVVSFVQFSGFFTMTGNATTTDHQLVCWTSPTELDEFEPSELPNGYWWSTYPTSPGVGTTSGPQHSVPFAVTYGQFVDRNQSLTLYNQCADLFAGSAPADEKFMVRTSVNGWAVPTDNNNFQPASFEITPLGESNVDGAGDPSG